MSQSGFEFRRKTHNYISILSREICESEFPDLEVSVHAFGSVPLKTCLRDGDLDLAVVLRPRNRPGLEADPGICDLFLTLLLEKLLEPEEDKLRPMSAHIVPGAAVPVLKVLCSPIEDCEGGPRVAVDITVNKLAGTGKLPFIAAMASYIGQDFLYQKSVLLIKAWMQYEARLLGSHLGLFSTFGVEVMVLALFANEAMYQGLRNPLQVLYEFLRTYAEFNWSTHVVSVCGLDMTKEEAVVQARQGVHVYPNAELSEYHAALYRVEHVLLAGIKHGSFAAVSHRDLKVTLPVNILDPLNLTNNLGRSVTALTLNRAVGAWKLALTRLHACIKEDLEQVLRRDVFKHCLKADHRCSSRRIAESTAANLPAKKPPLGPAPSGIQRRMGEDFSARLQVDAREISRTYAAAGGPPEHVTMQILRGGSLYLTPVIARMQRSRSQGGALLSTPPTENKQRNDRLHYANKISHYRPVHLFTADRKNDMFQ